MMNDVWLLSEIKTYQAKECKELLMKSETATVKRY